MRKHLQDIAVGAGEGMVSPAVSSHDPEGKRVVHYRHCYYWKDLAKGSPGEGAELNFKHVPVEMRCLDCSGAFCLDELEEKSMCEYCFGDHLQLLNEDDVRLEGIEIE